MRRRSLTLLALALVCLGCSSAGESTTASSATTGPVSTMTAVPATATVVPVPVATAVPAPTPVVTVVPVPAATVPAVPTVAAPDLLLNPVPFELPEWLEARGGHSVIWTGSELIVWGGWPSGSAPTAYADGAAYDPESKAWRALAEAPLAPRAYHAAVWTGEQMLIVGGQTKPGEVVDDGAAYDPASDSWIEIPATGETHVSSSPSPVEAVWTGQQLVMWYRDQGIVRAYDPLQDSWTVLPDLDLHKAEALGALRWTGSELVALAGEGPTALWAATLQPSVDSEWLELPPLSFARAGWRGDPFPSNSAVADGQLVVWSRSGASAPSFVLDMSTRSWDEIPTVPISPCEGHFAPLAMGSRILVMDTCAPGGVGGGGLYDAGTESWQVLQVGPDGQPNLGQAVWTGDEVLAIQTCCFGTGGRRFEWTGIRYTLD